MISVEIDGKAFNLNAVELDNYGECTQIDVEVSPNIYKPVWIKDNNGKIRIWYINNDGYETYKDFEITDFEPKTGEQANTTIWIKDDDGKLLEPFVSLLKDNTGIVQTSKLLSFEDNSRKVKFVKEDNNKEQFSSFPNIHQVSLPALSSLDSRTIIGCKNLNDVNISAVEKITSTRPFEGLTSINSIYINSSKYESVTNGFEFGPYANRVLVVNKVPEGTKQTLVSLLPKVTRLSNDNIDKIDALTLSPSSKYLQEVYIKNATTFDSTAFGGCQKISTLVVENNTLSSINDGIDGPNTRTIVLKKDKNGKYDILHAVTEYTKGISNDTLTAFSLRWPYQTPQLSGVHIQNQYYHDKFDGLAVVNNDETHLEFFSRTAKNAETYINQLTDLTSIGAYMFQSNKNISNLNLPNVKELGQLAFYNCYNLTSLSLPNLIETNAQPFQACSFKYLNIESLSVLKNQAFYAGNIPADAVIISPNVKIIDSIAFYAQQSLTSIQFLSSVENIKGNSFSNCTSIVSVDFPYLTNLGTGAFEYCYSLSSIHIPNVQTISNNVFKNNRALKTLSFTGRIDKTTPPTLTTTGAFSGASKISVLVDDESQKESFGSANNWKALIDQGVISVFIQ